ncbi:MAG TPA: PD-(D/E)XK nuclease superfamily protein [Polyangiaceae bacterium]|nr:PD-(D/E)XK nuclease superfamily protein [Polyangiaceae bacterium]
MSGRSAAPSGGDALELKVAALAERLGLEVRRQVKVGRRLWGAERRIDVVVTEPVSRRRLGLECKFQGVPGTAEEKIPTTIQDISAWPIPGIVVFSGEGFSPYMRSFLIASGRSVELEDLEAWLRLFFGLALE